MNRSHSELLLPFVIRYDSSGALQSWSSYTRRTSCILLADLGALPTHFVPQIVIAMLQKHGFLARRLRDCLEFSLQKSGYNSNATKDTESLQPRVRPPENMPNAPCCSERVPPPPNVRQLAYEHRKGARW